MLNLKTLKQCTNISDVIKSEGIDYVQEGESIKINCLFHKDETPSMSITDSQGKFHCFGCKTSGDILNIIQALHPSYSFTDSVKYLENNFFNSSTAHNQVINKAPQKTSKINTIEKKEEIIKDELYYEIMDYICSYYQEQLTDEIKDKYYLSKDIFDYEIYKGEIKTMSGYGFKQSSIEKYRLGYSPNSGKLYKLVIEKFGEGILEKYMVGGKLLGLFTRAKINQFKHRLVFPIIKNGRVVSFTSRQTEFTPSDKHNIQKYYAMSGEREFLFNEDDLINDYVIITEGISDCISLKEHGYSSIALGTTSIPKNILNRILVELQGKNVYILLDNESNSSGDKGAIKLSHQLSSASIENIILNLPIKEGEDKIDVNSYFKYHSKEDFMKLIGSQIM